MATTNAEAVTFLQRANAAFKDEDYSLAIELYKKVSCVNPVLAKSLDLNIVLATNRMARDHSTAAYTALKVPGSAANTAAGYLLKSQLPLTKPDSLADYFFDKIVESELFDCDYYTQNYRSLLKDVDNILEHYLEFGIELELNPSALFNTQHYLDCNPDVAAADIHPFIHYVCNGRAEGREAVAKPYHSRYEVAEVEYIPRLDPSIEAVTKVVRAICFYLPQFHAIPENDEWWGKGFTEWTNVKPALPQFDGHYQPHVPHEDIGYYNLLDRDAQAKQIELAKQYGIEGFCYYLYWFSGQRLLEQPLDNILADKTLDLPFCVCWANENWSRRWDGLENDLLMVQNYTDEDDIAFIGNIAKYLKDSRYIKIDGKPLLLIYRPNLFPSMKATAKRWRDWCRKNGIGEIYLAYPQSFESADPSLYGFDAAIEFPPNNSNPPRITHQVEPSVTNFESTVFDWRILLERSDAYIDPGYTLFRSATPSWDNTARKKNKGTVFHNSCPKLFSKYLTNAFSETLLRREKNDERIVFINAWNEWAEGAHLEPDQRYGYAWLQAVRDAHEACAGKKKRIVLVSHDAHPHGAQVLCLNIAKHLNQTLHFDVDLIVLGEGVLIPDFKQYAQVHQIKIETDNCIYIKKLLTDIYRRGAEAAIVNTTVSGMLTPYLKAVGFRVISLIHELPSVLNSYNLQQHAKDIEQHADKIIFPAKQVQQGFEQFLGRSVTQATIRPQGLFQPSILKSGKTKNDCKKDIINLYNLPSNAKIIANVAYADHRKGFDFFVTACMQVMQVIPNAYAIWIGHQDTALVESCMALVTDEKIRSRFILTNCYVNNPQDYYAAADVFALTSREDPFPSVVLESLDALTPIIAFEDCGGFENLLKRGCGVLVKKGDVTAYGNAIKSLLANPDKAKRLAETGKEIVETELSFRHYLYDLLELSNIPLPRISVVVPNYNYANYIESRLASITLQTFPIYELIVLDDHSTDNSKDIIQNFLQTCDIPHRFTINTKNSGSVFKQWEKGIALSRGDYIWIAEADDLSNAQFLEKLMPYFNDPEVILAYSQSKQIDQDDNLLTDNYLNYTNDIGNYWDDDYIIDGKEEIRRALCIKNTIPNVSGVVFKREELSSSFNNIKHEIKKYKVAGDWLIYIELAKNGKIAYSSTSNNLHRRHAISVTKKNNHMSEIVAVQALCRDIVQLPQAVENIIHDYNQKLEQHFGS